MKGKIIATKNIAKDVMEYIVQIDTPIRFIPGQYVMLSFEDKSKERRAYSIIQYDAMQRTISLLVKIAGAFTQKLSKMSVNDELFVYGPYGKFTLRENRKIMFISGGIGVVPLYSMFLHMLQTRNYNDIYFHYSCHYSNEMALKDELGRINLNNVHVKLYLTKEEPKSRFSIENVKTVKGFVDYDYYICGPEPMMDSIITELKGVGVTDKNIHKESYILRGLSSN